VFVFFELSLGPQLIGFGRLRWLETIFGVGRFVVLFNIFKVLLSLFIVCILHYLVEVMVYFHFHAVNMVVGQVFCANDLLVGGLNRHFLFQITFGLRKFLALIDELALIFIFWQAAIPVPRVHILDSRRKFL